jgi:hypothetical protein
MEQDEPPQNRTQRQVIEAEARVAAQVAWIAELRLQHQDTTEATSTLIALTNELLSCYAELGFEQAGRAGWRYRQKP